MTAAEEQAEYQALRFATDPIEAFNLFVKRHVDPSLHAHFADDDDNEAEYVRRAISLAIDRAARQPFATGGAGGGGGANSGVTHTVATASSHVHAGGGGAGFSAR